MVVKTKRITKLNRKSQAAKRKNKTLKGGGNHMPHIKTPGAWTGVKKQNKKKATISHPLTSEHVLGVGHDEITLGNKGRNGVKSFYKLHSSHLFKNLANKHTNAERRTAYLMNQNPFGNIVKPEPSIAELVAEKHRNRQIAALHPAILNDIRKKYNLQYNTEKNKEIEKFRQTISDQIHSIPNNKRKKTITRNISENEYRSAEFSRGNSLPDSTNV